jgi:FemAB-related protein (PEP-CTERM system-associated)
VFGSALSSLPYVNYGGVLADSPVAAATLFDCASRIAESRRLRYVLLRHRRQCFPQLTARTHKVTMLLPLAAEPQTMWNALDRKVRNQIRKAEKSHLSVVSGAGELLDGFYDVFARNMRDLGTPVYGRRLFAEILDAFPGAARVHVVRLGQQTIAGALSYSSRGVIEVPSASSLREHRSLCPNHLLYWHIMQEAMQMGVSTFDFGRSTPNDGTYAFKQSWGAVPEQLWWEYHPTSGRALPSADRNDSKFSLFIEGWKRLPVSVATLVGPSLVRGIP